LGPQACQSVGEVLIPHALDAVPRSGRIDLLTAVVVLDFGCGFAQESGVRELREGAPRDAHGLVDELALGSAPSQWRGRYCTWIRRARRSPKLTSLIPMYSMSAVNGMMMTTAICPTIAIENVKQQATMVDAMRRIVLDRFESVDLGAVGPSFRSLRAVEWSDGRHTVVVRAMIER
jgi:hypothetical protein